MRRRDFITSVGGVALAAGARPFIVRAQQPERPRRIGVLMPLSTGDPLGQANLALFRQALLDLGWVEGRNVVIDVRWCGGDPELTRKYVAEFTALAPDVILTAGNAIATPLLQATRTLPIVFVYLADPVGAGFVKSLRQPGTNATESCSSNTA